MVPRPRNLIALLAQLSAARERGLTILAMGLVGCAAAGPASPAAPAPAAMQVAAQPVSLAGARCENAGVGTYCRCRGAGDPAEEDPPSPGHKRFEIRASAAAGTLSVDSDVLGRFEVAGEQVRCLYVDMPAESQAKIRVTAKANDPKTGVLPEFAVAEYGPAGPYWYDVLRVQCQGQYGYCDREGAEAWKASMADRRRGRIDPCGSTVVKGLRWESSGSESSRDGGFFHDFTVSFDLEIKKFDTRFAPGSTECIPK